MWLFFSWKFKFTYVTSVPVSVAIAGLPYLNYLPHVSHYTQLCLCWLLVSAHTQRWGLGIFWHRYSTASGLLDYMLLLIFSVISLVRDHGLHTSNGEQRSPLPSQAVFCVFQMVSDKHSTLVKSFLSFFVLNPCFPLLYNWSDNGYRF